MSEGMQILAIHSLTRSLQSTGKRCDDTDRRLDTHTTDRHCDLEAELAQRIDLEKIINFTKSLFQFSLESLRLAALGVIQ